MLRHIRVVGIVLCMAMLAPVDAAQAGASHSTQTVQVVAPNSSAGAMEPDDLPAPQLEVVKHPTRVDVPAVPAFALPAGELAVDGARDPRARTVHSRTSSPDELEIE